METTEIWWPSRKALADLVVEDAEEGFTLSAPDGSECADWLSYYNQTEELREQFTAELTQALMNYLNKLQDEDGCPSEVPVGSEDSRPSEA